mmetsp:Transcript_56969/g.167267  ORF Transcript_56969/g.167267 Transcript_56969/m.167267 type:complete len:308 (+) Transcript_56969:57-980(+)
MSAPCLICAPWTLSWFGSPAFVTSWFGQVGQVALPPSSSPSSDGLAFCKARTACLCGRSNMIETSPRAASTVAATHCAGTPKCAAKRSATSAPDGSGAAALKGQLILTRRLSCRTSTRSPSSSAHSCRVPDSWSSPSSSCCTRSPSAKTSGAVSAVRRCAAWPHLPGEAPSKLHLPVCPVFARTPNLAATSFAVQWSDSKSSGWRTCAVAFPLAAPGKDGRRQKASASAALAKTALNTLLPGLSSAETFTGTRLVVVWPGLNLSGREMVASIRARSRSTAPCAASLSSRVPYSSLHLRVCLCLRGHS